MQQNSRWAAQSLTLLVMMGSLLYKTRAGLTGNPSYSNSVNEQHEAVSDSEGGSGSFNMLQGEIWLCNTKTGLGKRSERSTINSVSDLSIRSITPIPKRTD